MVGTLHARVAIEPACEHAEGPMWDGRDGTLVWIDQLIGRIRRARPDARGELVELPAFELGMAIGAVVPATDSGWVVAAGDGFHRVAVDGTVTGIADVLPQDPPRRRMNDGKVDPLGRLWAGSMAWTKDEGAGALYRLDADGVRGILDGVTISNGLGWPGDGSEMYYIDTPTQTVRRFTVTERGLADPVVVVRIPDEAGAPDGMCLDRDGGLWVALWGGSAVRHYAPSGELLDIVEVDAVQVSSCCFGGADGSTLFITTSAEDYSEDDLARDPHAGKLFRVETATGAGPARAYRG